MPVEKEDFRANLERITDAFPRMELIPAKDAAAWLGIDYRALLRNGPLKKIGGRYYVTDVSLARWLA